MEAAAAAAAGGSEAGEVARRRGVAGMLRAFRPHSAIAHAALFTPSPAASHAQTLQGAKTKTQLKRQLAYSLQDLLRKQRGLAPTPTPTPTPPTQGSGLPSPLDAAAARHMRSYQMDANGAQLTTRARGMSSYFGVIRVIRVIYVRISCSGLGIIIFFWTDFMIGVF